MSKLFRLPFERLGILNWGKGGLDWRSKQFHNIPLEKRPDYLELAVQRFEDHYNSSAGHARYGNAKFRLTKGRTMAKLRISEGNQRERIYAFIDINMKDPERYGGMMKPATYKAPEPKKYIRAHLFGKDPLRGATWYGPEYYDGGKGGKSGSDWFRGGGLSV
jgi:hypothetical protein